MDLFNYLAQEPTAVIILSGVLGLIVGSFLNVVIYRLPLMMQREWQAQCAELLATSQPAMPNCHEPVTANLPPFNLVYPRSHCPHCQHMIAAWENIPVLSYLWQRGRCTACQQPISWRYPFVEILSAVFAVITAAHFGYGLPLIGALILTWALIVLALIDFDTFQLPDDITLPFVWLGLLANYLGWYTTLENAVLGAILGYLSLWTVYWLFKLTTGKEGMGYGDFKLLALLGAWQGWEALLLIVLLSSAVGAVVGMLGILLRGRDKNIPIPFGPFLATAGWISFLWGHSIMQAYLSWTSL